MVKSSFEENDDILEPLGDQTQSVVPDSSQDENFGFGSNVNIEDVSFDENTMTGELVRLPERDEFLTEIKENLIVEFYNK